MILAPRLKNGRSSKPRLGATAPIASPTPTGGRIPPGPAFTIPVIGDTWSYYKNWQGYFDSMKQQYGPVFRTSLLGNPTSIVLDIGIAKQLLKNHDSVDMVMAPNPLMADKFDFGGQRGTQTLVAQSFRGSKFKAETWMEAFGPRHMPQFTPVIIDIFRDQLDRRVGAPTSSLQSSWGSCVGTEFLKQEFRAELRSNPQHSMRQPCQEELLHLLTIKIVWTRMIGRIPDDATQLLPMMAAMDVFTEDVLSVPLPNPLRIETKLDRAKRTLCDIALATVEEQTALYNEYKAGRYEAADTQKNSLVWCILEHSRQTGEAPTTEDWMSNIISGFFAGHETTRWILCTLLYELSKSPATLKHVAAELSALQEEFGPDFMSSRKAQEKMVYTDAVWSEALRHGLTRLKYAKNIAAFQPRALARDIFEGGFRFPMGERILVPTPYLAYTDRSFWLEDGEHDASFRPERFLQGNEMEGFVPFGYGPKTCPGQALATAEAKAMLYLLTLGGYKIDVTDSDEAWRTHGITSTPVSGACKITRTA